MVSVKEKQRVYEYPNHPHCITLGTQAPCPCAQGFIGPAKQQSVEKLVDGNQELLNHVDVDGIVISRLVNVVVAPFAADTLDTFTSAPDVPMLKS